MATLTEKQTELTNLKASLVKAQDAFQYAVGDRQVSRQNIRNLQNQIAIVSREIDELTAAAAGAKNPLITTPKWV